MMQRVRSLKLAWDSDQGGWKTLILLILWGAFFLTVTACATQQPEPRIVTQRVEVPVDDPRCVREALARLGPSPAYPDTDSALRAAENVFAGVQLLQAGRLLRIAREAELMAALAGCG